MSAEQRAKILKAEDVAQAVLFVSTLPPHVTDLIDAGLKGAALVQAGEAVTITRSVPHGHVAAAWAMAARLGLPALLGPPCAERAAAWARVLSGRELTPLGNTPPAALRLIDRPAAALRADPNLGPYVGEGTVWSTVTPVVRRPSKTRPVATAPVRTRKLGRRRTSAVR